MNDRYLFKAKRVDNQEWIFGSLINTSSGPYIFEDGYDVAFVEPDYHQQGMGCGLEDRGINDRYDAMAHGFEKAIERVAENYPPFIPVIADTICAFTTLTDKNGERIWESDFVKTPTGATFVIKWVQKHGDENVIAPGWLTYGWEPESLEVLRSIHDNQALNINSIET